MKKITKNLLPLVVLFSLLTIISCGEDNEPILVNTGDGIDAKLNNSASDSLSATVFTADIEDGEINVRLALESDETMRRVYITKNQFGAGFETVDAAVEFNTNAKGDGSIDLPTASQNGTVFFFNFDLTSFPNADGTIVYKFWATKNKGDHRDDTKDIVESVVTLTINLGGSNPAAGLVSVSDVQLFAPTADLMSKSFASTADGVVYDLDDFENSDLWDVGYTAQANNPRLTSAFSSPQRFFAPGSTTVTESFQELIERETGAPASDLNMVYFVELASTFDFDGATTASDFNSLSVSTSDAQTINIPTDANGYLIAFLDQYGKKGVIRIDALVDGDSDGNYFESNDYVQIDIKVQP